MRSKKIIARISALIMCTAMLPAFTAPDFPAVKSAETQPAESINESDSDFIFFSGTSRNDIGEKTITQTGSNSADITCAEDGAFEFYAKKYFNPTNPYFLYGDIKVSYDIDFDDFDPKTNDAYLCVSGELEAGKTEFHIVEAWGAWRPTTGKFLETVTVDDAQYEVYLSNEISNIAIHPVSTVQYWIVREENRLSESGNITGTVSVSEHLKVLEKNGLNYVTSPLNFAGLTLNVYQTDFKGRINSIKVDTEVPEEEVTEKNPDTRFSCLKDGWTDDFRVGTAMSAVLDNTSDRVFAAENYNLMTVGEELDPVYIYSNEQNAYIHRSNYTGVTLYGGLRDILDLCKKNGIPFHGKKLISNDYVPYQYYTDKDGNLLSAKDMDERLESYIKNTFDMYSKNFPEVKIESYEVCSDIFGLIDGLPPYGKESVWKAIYGDDSFIENAFEYARKYAPKGCKLYLPDENVYTEEETDRLCGIASALKEKGLADGIAMCSSFYVGAPEIADYEAALKKYTDAGLEIIVSGLEIMQPEDYESQTKLYGELFRLYHQYSDSINAVITKKPYDYEHEGNNIFAFTSNRRKSYYSVMGVAAELAGEKNNGIPARVSGDADGNGIVNSADMITLLNAMTGQETITPQLISACDMNGDNFLSVIDIIKLKSLIFG